MNKRDLIKPLYWSQEINKDGIYCKGWKLETKFFSSCMVELYEICGLAHDLYFIETMRNPIQYNIHRSLESAKLACEEHYYSLIEGCLK